MAVVFTGVNIITDIKLHSLCGLSGVNTLLT